MFHSFPRLERNRIVSESSQRGLSSRDSLAVSLWGEPEPSAFISQMSKL